MQFTSYTGGVVTLLKTGHEQHEQHTGVECLMTNFEPLLYDAVCKYLPQNCRAAEVGSFKGGSACILWNGMHRRGKSLVLACHDLFQPSDLHDERADFEPVFDLNVRTWDAGVIKVKGDSKVTHAIHAPGHLDYCFVDGDHTYEGAKADILNFYPKVAKDGWFLVQDCIGDVERAVKDTMGRETDVFSFLISPPMGHYVRVFHRDKSVLTSFLDDLHNTVARLDQTATTLEFPALE